MTWQDVIIGAGQLLFAVALFPALASATKPPRFTCLLTCGVLFAFAGTFATLAFWWSATMSLACATLWLILGLQGRAPALRREPTESERRRLARQLTEEYHRRRRGG